LDPDSGKIVVVGGQRRPADDDFPAPVKLKSEIKELKP
jgi:hypothetical protein